MSKKAFFYIDDVIWVFRDLTRNRPSKLFDHPFLKLLKEAHDKYGMKTQLNIFYQTDENYYGYDHFNLSEMTDAYKDEWQQSCDWLKFGFHARQEFPDYPYINADYDDVMLDFKRMEKEVLRFAGENMIAKGCTPHWRPISKDACLALRDCGIKLISATYGRKIAYNGPDDLPYGHAARLLCNRKPETSIFIRDTYDVAISKSLCGYNHITEGQREKTMYNFDCIKDEQTGLFFKDIGNILCVNHHTLESIKPIAEEKMGVDFYAYATHEQYFFPEYFAYQQDYSEKVLYVAKQLYENGYEYIFSQDLVTYSEK